LAKNRVQVNYLDFTFTVFAKYDVWQLSFKNPNDGKVVKRSTKLPSTPSNLIAVRKEIIPSLVEYLTGQIDTVQEEKEFTLDEFAEEYFELHKARVREHTASKNKKHYHNHIKPYFGHRLIISIKPIELEKWQISLKKDYKPLTIQKYRSVLFSIFDEAIRNELIQVNPLSKVIAPKINKSFDKSENDEIYPFSKAELQNILENSDGYMYNFILLMYSTGIRPGEIIALKWEDIDFDRKQIDVHKTIVHGTIGHPKTPSSVRKVDMLPTTEKALKLQYKFTKDYEYIFINASKKHFYSHDIINLKFKKVLMLSAVESRSLYNLRHSFASQLISDGEDIVWVSRTLGHLDVSITLKYYTKFIKEDEETRLKKISKIGANFGANFLT